jgi:hypothetical protein
LYIYCVDADEGAGCWRPCIYSRAELAAVSGHTGIPKCPNVALGSGGGITLIFTPGPRGSNCSDTCPRCQVLDRNLAVNGIYFMQRMQATAPYHSCQSRYRQLTGHAALTGRTYKWTPTSHPSANAQPSSKQSKHVYSFTSPTHGSQQ